jgi:hypothetical protein
VLRAGQRRLHDEYAVHVFAHINLGIIAGKYTTIKRSIHDRMPCSAKDQYGYFDVMHHHAVIPPLISHRAGR